MADLKKINVGCGMTPTSGWLNYDNSLSVKLAGRQWLTTWMSRLGLLTAQQKEYIDFCRGKNILWADVARSIPVSDGSADALYSSHMLEHMDKADAIGFLHEVHRVLAPGGVVRISVPDVEKITRAYLQHHDADSFMEVMHTCVPRPRGLISRLRAVLVGERHHLWMYDGQSLAKLLETAGFQNASIIAPGQTLIAQPGTLNLHERDDESVYVEAFKARV